MASCRNAKMAPKKPIQHPFWSGSRLFVRQGSVLLTRWLPKGQNGFRKRKLLPEGQNGFQKAKNASKKPKWRPFWSGFASSCVTMLVGFPFSFCFGFMEPKQIEKICSVGFPSSCGTKEGGEPDRSNLEPQTLYHF